MNILDIISKKQEGIELSMEELKFVVDGFCSGDIPNYQMSAFLMAVYFKGMTDDEALNFTYAMRDSGDVLNHDRIKGLKFDKHSTGGVGDKTTLVIGPMIASLGLKFSKMSGRALGHTGGTIDKLEAIKDFNVSLSEEDFYKQVNDIGIAVISQSANLAPADKLIYALRDITSTVSSIPLIASSIMSKKLAANDDLILLDVKVGSGAFMQNIEEAKKLAKLMVGIGNKAGKRVSAILTNMDEPLGNAIGNSLEVLEAINTLKGNGPKDLEDLCVEITKDALLLSGLETSSDIALEKAKNTLHDGSAYEKFISFVVSQGADLEYIKNYENEIKVSNIVEYYAPVSGYIEELDAKKIGLASQRLGAGRLKLDDKIDYNVGIVLNHKVGDYVNKGDVILKLYVNQKGINEALEFVKSAIKIGKTKKDTKLILDFIK